MSRVVLSGCLGVLLVFGIGCGSSDGGSATGGAAGAATGGTSSGGASTGGSGGTSTGGSGGTSSGGSGGSGGTSSGGSGGSGDPFEAARQTCIDHINELRAGKGRSPYTRWTAEESCVDEEATYDSSHGPHASYIAGNTCNAYGQGECPGSGPESVTSCIDLMWAEKDQSICSGCDQCPSLNDGFAGNCPNCQVTTSNPTCGHYLALVSPGFSMAACGFSTAGPYTAINYQ